MWMIVGLGNPGKQYIGTRHNAGFDVIDCLAEKYGISVTERKGRAFVGAGWIEGQKVLLVKPQTYMNLSGESVQSLVNYFKIQVDRDLLVVFDDISLEPGQIRIRRKGSAGGHNGIKNMIQMLHTEEFSRIKIGVGKKPSQYDLADFVLGHFSKQEREKMREGYGQSLAAIVEILQGRMEVVMNQFNRKGRAEE